MITSTNSYPLHLLFELKNKFHFSNFYLNSDRKYWKGLLTGIRRTTENSVNADPNAELPFNVIMYGFDSLSRNAFMRKLPRAYEYMTKHLNADVLQSYNIVGDGTPQALIPVGRMNLFFHLNDILTYIFFLNQ